MATVPVVRVPQQVPVAPVRAVPVPLPVQAVPVPQPVPVDPARVHRVPVVQAETVLRPA
jgi:hypothetical protein